MMLVDGSLDGLLGYYLSTLIPFSAVIWEFYNFTVKFDQPKIRIPGFLSIFQKSHANDF